MENNKKIKAAIIGFGRMGGKYLKRFKERPDQWEVAYICDIDSATLDIASRLSPESKLITDYMVALNDPEVEVVVLSTLANNRKEHFAKALQHGKHVMMEKPIADTLENEWEVVKLAEASRQLATVNLYQRNSWYNKLMRKYIADGEIGDLAIIRICHMTPGLAPGEGHEYEGPAFHDCGMHYVDLARWFAGSEYKTWNAQGVRMWDYKDPWWVQVHGTFENGVVFDITQGFVYGQLSKDQTHNTYTELIGTKGIVRLTHDFQTATVELRGVNTTETTKLPYGDKNINIMCRELANSIAEGRLSDELPTLRDAAIASDYAWRFFHDTRNHDLPSIGDNDTLVEIRRRRATMTDGYGLLRRRPEIDPKI